MSTVARVVLVVLGIIIALVAAGWLGLQVKPRAFPAYPERTPPLETVDLPEGLPAPVERFYQTIYGEQVPFIESAVYSGRASLRLGVRFFGRYRFVHLAGHDYRHYIEGTLYGIPILTVNEWYLDGTARNETPAGVVENDPQVDEAANMGLWAETLAFPSIFVTDPRVRWEAVDDTTARLIVPFGDEENTFTVTFDPQTGLVVRMEAVRYKGTTGVKVRWWGEPVGWQTVHGFQMPAAIAVTWEDEGTPWAVFAIEDVVFNVDVSDYVRARGL